MNSTMTYPETIQYLYTQLPLFTRVGQSAYKANLDNTIELCARLGDPQHKFRSIHVGGTNGKGSTSHMLAAILQVAGYKTGLYTSPHLKDFRERIRVNGQMISEQSVIDFVKAHRLDFDEIQPSFFEMTVALAFDVFAKEKVDIAVIEVGLGGRLDSTNIIIPTISVITNIGWDHMNILGHTLPLIAAEKAGIIKPNIPVIVSEYQPEVAGVFISKAEETNARLTFASEVLDTKIAHPTHKTRISKYLNLTITQLKTQNTQHTTQNPQHTTHNLQHTTHPSQLTTHKTQYTTHNIPLTTHASQLTTHNLQLDLPGSYQQKNVKAVLCVIEELRAQGFNITDEHIKTALRQVKTLTGLHGRWEVLSKNPLTICDTGHNPEGIAEVLQNIATVKYDQLHFVLGVVNDKDSSKILQMLPAPATYYFCRPDIPRGLDAQTLKENAAASGLHGDFYPSVKAAVTAAQTRATKNDLIFIGGSTFVVAEAV